MDVAMLPPETDAPLIVDADAVASRERARELFQAIAGRHTQIIDDRRGVEHP